MGSGGLDPLIRNLRTYGSESRHLLFPKTSPSRGNNSSYPRHCSLGAFQCRYGRFGEGKFLALAQDRTIIPRTPSP